MTGAVDRQGYHMPPEWAAHQGTWFSWPHNSATWPDRLPQAERALAEAVAALSRYEPVWINVLDTQHAAHVRALLSGRARLDAITFETIRTNDAWCRDHGAIFVHAPDGDLTALDFRFNAWGGKYQPYDLDDAVPPQMAARLGVPLVRVDHVLEGGSIDTNGAGVLLTTEQCLLNPNRNPGRSRGEIERLLDHYLGTPHVCWLGEGILGDDTDGHVDDITRFVAAAVIVTAVESDGRDANHRPLAENRERLADLRLADGSRPEIVALPMPDAQYYRGERLPASYANFLIANGVVLVPVFACARDAEALDVLRGCFPGRDVVGIDCRDIVVGLGTLHCLSQQVPAIAPGVPAR